MATYLLVGIDDRKWQRFKATCDLQGVTIKETLLNYIDQEIITFNLLPLHTQVSSGSLKKGGKKK